MRRFVSLFLTLLILAGCAKTPVTHRSQLILISPKEEMALGLREAEKIKKESKLLPDSDPRVQRVRRIGERIAAVANRSDFQWEFNVIESDQVNAFCLPGGKVFFYTGILKLTSNDDQIATVMGHEIAHALARHGAERMSMQMLAQAGAIALAVGTRDSSPAERAAYLGAYGLGSTLGVMLPYSRKHEHEADEIGIYLMWKAGYNPHEAVKFWKKMAKLSEGKAPPEFLSTHPSDASRIKAIEEYIKTLPEHP